MEHFLSYMFATKLSVGTADFNQVKPSAIIVCVEFPTLGWKTMWCDAQMKPFLQNKPGPYLNINMHLGEI